MKKRNKNTLTGALLFALTFAIIGGFMASLESSKPTSTPTTTNAVPVMAAAPVAKPVAIAAHPAESELNKLGLTLEGGIGVRAGTAETQQGGTK